MKTILQIRTRSSDDLAGWLVAPVEGEDCRWEVVDISEGTQDYDALLDHVFRADAVHVW